MDIINDDVGFMRTHGCVGTARLRVAPHAALHGHGGGGGAAASNATAPAAPNATHRCEWSVDAHSESGSMFESASLRVPRACFDLPPPSAAAGAAAAVGHPHHHHNESVWLLDVHVDAVPGSDAHIEGCSGVENRFKLTRLVTCAPPSYSGIKRRRRRARG